MLGPTAGSNIGPTPDAFEARSDWAQLGAKDFGPLAGPAHKGSSNGGPDASSSSKLLRPGLTAKNKMPKGVFYPKRNLEGGGSLETNRDTSRGKSHSRKSDFSTGFETSKVSTGETEGEEGILQCKLINEVRTPFSAVSERDLPLSGAFEPNFILETSVSLVHPSRCHSFSSIPLESRYAVQRGSVLISPVVNNNHRGGASCSEGVVVPLETSNRKFKDWPFLRETLSNPEVRGVSGEASFPVQEPSTLEGFQVEGLTPWKMVKVQSVLESLRVRIVRDNGKGVEGENKSASLCRQGSRKKRKTVRRFLSTQNPDVVMLQETKREIWDRRSVSSVWKVYGPNKAVWRKDFWMELQDLHGLTFPRWCVGGDFNVIRRISEKMGDSRLTVNMRCFDEFIRESGLLDPPLRNAAFTWSNMQVDPICKRLDRFLFSSEWDSFSLKYSRDPS
ncbi:hypothetical protein CK203_012704 [Vitis vinifera]|uniref:Endonuclease/exonuclease/phosphatase domain-containing protein n=1 Tax=Vitis vinifera TaxID=29760 RepID=A0A438KMH5_VITVI|nr:hypothetical protein CK203_012704 [Vitis vinifera]